jgi:hypothetical protein
MKVFSRFAMVRVATRGGYVILRQQRRREERTSTDAVVNPLDTINAANF